MNFDSLNLLRKLVETESPSHDKSAVDKVGRLVAEECRKLEPELVMVENDHYVACHLDKGCGSWGKS